MLPCDSSRASIVNSSRITSLVVEARNSPIIILKKMHLSKSSFEPGMSLLENNNSIMYYLIFKYLLTASMVVIISEIAKRYDRVGAIIVSLPLVTILVMIWMYLEKTPIEKISNHVYYTFWYVPPTLPMFLIFPYLLNKYGFWLALLTSGVFTIVFFFLFAFILKKF